MKWIAPAIKTVALPGFIGLTWVLWVFSGQFTIAQPRQQPVSITISDNRMYVPVWLNGRGPYHFLLDFREPGMGRIDQRLAKELGLTIVGFEEITTGYQVKRAFLVGIGKLSVGQTAQLNLKLRVEDYNTIPNQIPIDGIIGRAFFANYLLMIDGPARQLTTTQNTLQAQDKDILTYTDAFLVRGKIGVKEMLFNLDIGSGLPQLFPVSSLTGVDYTTTANQRVITQTKPPLVLKEAIVNDDIILGGVRLKRQTVYYSDKVHQISLGIDFLKEHTLSLDQRNKLIRIQ